MKINFLSHEPYEAKKIITPKEMGETYHGIPEKSDEDAHTGKMIHHQDADEYKRGIASKVSIFYGGPSGKDVFQDMGSIKGGDG